MRESRALKPKEPQDNNVFIFSKSSLVAPSLFSLCIVFLRLSWGKPLSTVDVIGSTWHWKTFRCWFTYIPSSHHCTFVFLFGFSSFIISFFYCYFLTRPLRQRVLVWCLCRPGQHSIGVEQVRSDPWSWFLHGFLIALNEGSCFISFFKSTDRFLCMQRWNLSFLPFFFCVR